MKSVGRLLHSCTFSKAFAFTNWLNGTGLRAAEARNSSEPSPVVLQPASVTRRMVSMWLRTSGCLLCLGRCAQNAEDRSGNLGQLCLESCLPVIKITDPGGQPEPLDPSVPPRMSFPQPWREPSPFLSCPCSWSSRAHQCLHTNEMKILTFRRSQKSELPAPGTSKEMLVLPLWFH